MIEQHDPRLRLCLVTDDLRDARDGLVSRTAAAESGGATMVILRLKHADAATMVEVGRALVQALRIPVLVHERLDVALACGAAGVHLTTDSIPAVAVRTQVPDSFVIGVAIASDAELATAHGADFITVGPIFSESGARLPGFEALGRLQRATGLPAVAIGGLTPALSGVVRRAGAAGVAVIGAVLASADAAASARAFVAALDTADDGGENDEAPDHVV